MKMFQISIKDYTQYNINSRYIFVLQFHCMAVFQLYFDSFPLFKHPNSNRTIFYVSYHAATRKFIVCSMRIVT